MKFSVFKNAQISVMCSYLCRWQPAYSLSVSPNYSGQLSLLPSVGWKMSTNHSVMMLRGWGVRVGWLIPCGWTCGWQVKLCDPSLARATLSALEMSISKR